MTYHTVMSLSVLRVLRVQVPSNATRTLPSRRSDAPGRPIERNGLLRPFLRWAGGKQRLIRELLRFVPPAESYGRYYEPFVGAGSMFFAVRPSRATLGDINGELINCYQAVAAAPKEVSRLLAG
jgi:hypothetical protein